MSEVESINPNTPVTSPLTDSGGKAVLEGGEAAMTFDELEELTIKSKSAKKEPKKESEKDVDLTSDDKKGKKEEPKQEAKKETKEKDDVKADPKKDEKPRKTVKAKFNDTEIDLDEDALIPVTINGQEELWTLKELRNQQSGKVAYDKKFSELDRIRKEVTQKDKSLQETNQLIKSIFEEKDPTIKIFKMSQLIGADPVEFRNNFLSENMKILEKWYSMSEDERKADAREYEARIQKHRADTLEARLKDQEAEKDLMKRVESVRASHKISEEDFFGTLDKLNAQVELGKLDPSVVTPENIAKAYKADLYFNETVKALDPLSKSLSGSEYQRALIDISQSALEMGLNLEDIKDIVDQVYGKGKAAKKVADKKKEVEEFTTGKKEVTQTVSRSQPVFFDEI